jgi:predicted nucleic acid-binding protein
VKAFVDTNVLVYAVDRADPVRRARAREVLALGADGGLVVSAQVLAEFLVVTRRLAVPVAPAVARELARTIAGAAEVIAQSSELVLAASERAEREQLSLWDAMIVQAAVDAGCDVLLTEDLQHGREHDGLVVRDPFRDGAD